MRQSVGFSKRAAQSGGPFFLIDEVFIDFCEQASLKRFLDRSQKLAIIRSFTKFYGLPGLRIGYLLAPPQIAARVRQPSSTLVGEHPGPGCGRLVLYAGRYRRKTLELIEKNAKGLQRELSAVSGLKVFPAQANYLLVRMDRSLKPASRLKWDIFERDRILIRDCGSFEGLDDWYFRVAVRLPDQNDRLIAAIKIRSERSFLTLQPRFRSPGLKLIRFVFEKQPVILAIAQVAAHEFRDYAEQPVYFLIARGGAPGHSAGHHPRTFEDST